MNHQTTINWNQATEVSKQISEQQRIEREITLKEVKESDFSMYDARDIQHFATILDISPNEVRTINMKAQELTGFDFIKTFENDETDDIFDFY